MNHVLVTKPDYTNSRMDVDPKQIMELCHHTEWLSVLSHIISSDATVGELSKQTGIHDTTIYTIVRVLESYHLIKSRKEKRMSVSRQGRPTVTVYTSLIARLNFCVDRFGIFAEYVMDGETRRSDSIRMEPKNL